MAEQPTQYGYAGKKDDLQMRLRRVEGQVRGVSRMVDEDKYCIDIITQITAAHAALDRVALELLREHAKHCLADDELNQASRDGKANELVGAIGRLIGR